MGEYTRTDMQKRWLVGGLAVGTITLIVGGIAIRSFIAEEKVAGVTSGTTPWSAKAAERQGKSLSNGRCRGMDVRKLGTLPMQYNDFSMIVPYGLVVGDHVTPIDHQYFSPTVFHSPRDKYEVRAMADATIVDIGSRAKPGYTEYRLVFSISCRLFYYYDLVTSLAPGLTVGTIVKEGEVIGRIGGQTLDFAVWDTTQRLSGFVHPQSYEEERWKIHTVDPLEYYTDSLKQQALTKYLRTIPPVSGKIDYDIDGRLVGNWFQEGTNGYQGLKRQSLAGYSRTHLAIVPNHLQPSVYMASFGNFAGQFKQLAIRNKNPDPQNVSVATGFVQYDLAEIRYTREDGREWNGMEFTRNPKVKMLDGTSGCALYQLLADRRLQAETFSDTTCVTVKGFTSRAIIYTR